MCAASSHVRFTPDSDRESDFPQTVMSALPPKADMCSALADVCFGPKADIGTIMSVQGERGSARQNDPDFGELARLRIDLDRAAVLLHDDVVADGEAKAGAFSGRLGCEERVEHLFFHVRRHSGAVVANSDFHTVAKVFGRGRERRLVVATIGLRSALGRRIEAV